MRELKLNFPVKSNAVTMELVGHDICPVCAGPLDRAKICTECKSEWYTKVPSRFNWRPIPEKD